MNLRFVATVIVFACVNATNLFAQSFITQLPKDGTWARYEYSVDHTPTGEGRQRVTGDCVIQSVGVEERDGAKYRWIELVFTNNWSNIKKPTIYRMLIKEDLIGKNVDPRSDLKFLASSSLQPEGPHVTDYLKSKRRVPIIEYLLPPPMANKKAMATKKIKTHLGELDCKGISGSAMNDLFSDAQHATGLPGVFQQKESVWFGSHQGDRGGNQGRGRRLLKRLQL